MASPIRKNSHATTSVDFRFLSRSIESLTVYPKATQGLVDREYSRGVSRGVAIYIYIHS